MRRHALRPFAGAVERLASTLAPATVLADVQRVWPEVAGAVVAREAEPTSERDGIVTVSCRAAVWAQELDLMGADLTGRINTALGRDAVRSLRCVATPAPR